MKYKIKEIRESKGMSQKELADKSGISRVTIWALENNEEKITTTRTLTSLADALEVDMNELFLTRDA